MPGHDNTGPAGQGAGTGRGFGPCSGASKDTNTSFYGRGYGFALGLGLGFGRGRGAGGRGRGFGNRCRRPAMSPPLPFTNDVHREADILRLQAQAMQERLDAINKRLEQLESNNTAGSADKTT